jgi:hypothetical protein
MEVSRKVNNVWTVNRNKSKPRFVLKHLNNIQNYSDIAPFGLMLMWLIFW